MAVHDSEKTVPSSLQVAPSHFEDVVAGEKNAGHTGDYAGAVAKTSPEEIALVRKLDWRIMPTLFAMYFLYESPCPAPLGPNAHIRSEDQQLTHRG